jgi:hypothetical protein
LALIGRTPDDDRARIRPAQSFYREKLDGGLSSATVRKMHGVLQKALDQAVSEGLLPRNAARGIRLPQCK